MPAPGPKARLQCHYCARLLEYDAGAQYVQCFSCSSMNSAAQQANNQVGGRVLSMICGVCNTTNLAPYGFNFVRCGQCGIVSQVSHAYANQPRSPQVQQQVRGPQSAAEVPASESLHPPSHGDAAGGQGGGPGGNNISSHEAAIAKQQADLLAQQQQQQQQQVAVPGGGEAQQPPPPPTVEDLKRE